MKKSSLLLVWSGVMLLALTTTVFAIGCLAFYHIRKREIPYHREWMLRAFSIGLGVSTIRYLVLAFQGFTSLRFQEFFGIPFWLAFVMHFIFAEVWIHLTRPKAVVQFQ